MESLTMDEQARFVGQVETRLTHLERNDPKDRIRKLEQNMFYVKGIGAMIGALFGTALGYIARHLP